MLLAVILARESPGVRLGSRTHRIKASPALKHPRKSKQIKKKEKKN